jgi:putative flippase GtrA
MSLGEFVRTPHLQQFVRFGLSGGVLAVLVAGGYWLIATFLHVDPNLSLLIVFLVASVIGYLLHSRFSFQGYGGRDRVHVRTARFLVTNTLGLLCNQFLVWLLVKQLGGPTWWPVIPILFLTPLFTFTLNRKWVFG